MRVTVRYFARFREVFGVECETIECSAGESVAGLRALLAERDGKWGEEFMRSRQVMVVVNEEITGPDTILQEADEVAFFPPVTGG